MARGRTAAAASPLRQRLFQCAPSRVVGTLARLEAADVLQKLRRKDEARLEVEAFNRAWSQSELPAYLRRRSEGILPASKLWGLV